MPTTHGLRSVIVKGFVDEVVILSGMEEIARHTRSYERLTGALLDRLTHHVHILEMNGDSYRLKQSKARNAKQST